MDGRNILLLAGLFRPIRIHPRSWITVCQKPNQQWRSLHFLQARPHLLQKALCDSSRRNNLTCCWRRIIALLVEARILSAHIGNFVLLKHRVCSVEWRNGAEQICPRKPRVWRGSFLEGPLSGACRRLAWKKDLALRRFGACSCKRNLLVGIGISLSELVRVGVRDDEFRWRKGVLIMAPAEHLRLKLQSQVFRIYKEYDIWSRDRCTTLAHITCSNDTLQFVRNERHGVS